MNTRLRGPLASTLNRRRLLAATGATGAGALAAGIAGSRGFGPARGRAQDAVNLT